MKTTYLRCLLCLRVITPAYYGYALVRSDYVAVANRKRAEMKRGNIRE